MPIAPARPNVIDVASGSATWTKIERRTVAPETPTAESTARDRRRSITQSTIATSKVAADTSNRKQRDHHRAAPERRVIVNCSVVLSLASEAACGCLPRSTRGGLGWPRASTELYPSR